ncbi:MAG TPA: helix-turn-helix domain-containing protein [Holophagaceae bacterium]|nr:helix-turn-helix domain-containing protein [Holophagaceae bacterium]
MATRAYDNTYRTQAAEATRRRILESMVELVAAGGVEEAQAGQVAAKAGISERTLYRHFPDREALLEGLAAFMNEQILGLPDLTAAGGAQAIARSAFPLFDAHEALVRAYLRTGTGQASRLQFRGKRLHRTLQKDLDPDGKLAQDPDRAARLAVIQALVSAEVWRDLKDSFHLDGRASGEAVAWAIQVLKDALKAT